MKKLITFLTTLSFLTLPILPNTAKEKERIKIEREKIQLEREKIELEKEKEERELEKKQNAEEKKKKRKKKSRGPLYTYKAFDKVKKKLIISDRKVMMPKVINATTANKVVKEIQYYNGVNNYPIFVIMDDCYGGSVSAGEKIIRAIYSSEAKVYVVIEKFAASMCAIIAGNVKYSYTYPNAVILHHQIMTTTQGNIREHTDSVNFMYRWQKRLLAPIANRMGVTVNQFIKYMYINDANGNWGIFGTKAVKMKWVRDVVMLVKDTSVKKKPRQGFSFASFFGLEQDKQGRYILPKLAKYDFYYLYNDGRFVIQ